MGRAYAMDAANTREVANKTPSGSTQPKKPAPVARWSAVNGTWVATKPNDFVLNRVLTYVYRSYGVAARIYGVAYATVGEWRTGRRQAPLDVVEQLSKELDALAVDIQRTQRDLAVYLEERRAKLAAKKPKKNKREKIF